MIVELLKYILLGIIQGISEILPISSSGHLALAQQILKVNADNEALFAIFVHFASLLALLIFFRKTIWEMIKGSFNFVFKKDKDSKDNFMLLVYMVVASIPVGVIGILFEDKINSIFGNLLFVGLGFLFTAITLFLISFLKDSEDNTLSFKKAMITGLFECIGIIPGISRSGITMSGGKIAKLGNEKAKQFAFLLFIPVAAGSFIFSIGDGIDLIKITSSETIILYLISMVTSFIFTYLALIYIFKKFSINHYRYFSIYMVLISAFTITYYFLA